MRMRLLCLVSLVNTFENTATPETTKQTHIAMSIVVPLLSELMRRPS